MPHQCLKCGHVFDEGSSQLLIGCPDCGGNRFFFTKEPLNEKERNEITNKVGKDINSTILELIGKHGKDIIDQSGNWVNLKPDDVRKAMEQQLSEQKKIAPKKKEDINTIIDHNYRKEAIEKIKSEIQESDTPETIGIERPGKYKINIKGLLEKEPIIIHKDGSYTIHLPSIFKMIDKEKKY